MRLIIAVLFLILVSDSFAQVKMVVTVFRHGARRATKKAGYLKELDFELGALTGPGMRTLYLIGKHFRKKYQYLLSESYKPNEIYVRTTFEERTMTSASSFLLGLYEFNSGPQLTINKPKEFLQEVTNPPFVGSSYPYIEDKFALQFGYQAIPIHTNVKSTPDFILKAGKSCEKADLSEEERKSDGEMKSIDNQYKDLYNKIQVDLKLQKSPNIREVRKVFSNLVTELYESLETPYSPESQTWRDLEFLHDYQIIYVQYGDDYIARLAASGFLQQVLNHFTQKIEGKSSVNLGVYSAHDTTLTPILRALDLMTAECFKKKHLGEPFGDRYCVEFPVFASTITFELHQEIYGHSVTLIYNNQTYNPCKYSTEEKKCPFDEFKKRLEGIIITNVEKECSLKKEEESTIPTVKASGGKSYGKIILYVVLVVINLCLVGAYFYFKRVFQKRVFGQSYYSSYQYQKSV